MIIEYRKEGKIAFFTINHPPLNSITLEGIKEYSAALTDFRDDSDLWVGIITGKGRRAFCAGGDIADMLPTMKKREAPQKASPTPQRGLELWKPLIAAVNGIAIGGGLEIALTCDIRVASENARFGLPEVNVGLIPGWGGTQRLPRQIPWCKAAEMIFTGQTIDAQEAYRIGLVNQVVPLESLLTVAREYADAICQAAPLAVQAAKEAMWRGLGMTLEEGLQLEDKLVYRILTTQDFIEGTAAFLEKRNPLYKGQ